MFNVNNKVTRTTQVLVEVFSVPVGNKSFVFLDYWTMETKFSLVTLNIYRNLYINKTSIQQVKLCFMP